MFNLEIVHEEIQMKITYYVILEDNKTEWHLVLGSNALDKLLKYPMTNFPLEKIKIWKCLLRTFIALKMFKY